MNHYQYKDDNINKGRKLYDKPKDEKNKEQTKTKHNDKKSRNL